MYLYLEDLTDGLEFDLGSFTVTKEAMLDFSEKFDPQVFHLDDEAGEKMFGGIIASGWHTASIGQRMLVDNFLKQAACMASPGVDELLFLKPVYADDVLTGTLIVEGTRISKSKPDRGLLKVKTVICRADGAPVMSMVGNVIVGCRPK
jgi:acyl dehydratase